MKYLALHLLLMTLTLTLSGCSKTGENKTGAQTNAEQTIVTVESASAERLPPGFLDDAPAPPTSENHVFSGGTLVLDEEINDAVVVIAKGKLVSWGKRGEVDVPNDSIGYDMRGKWLVPGATEDLEDGPLPNQARWQPNAGIELLILNQPPQTGGVPVQAIHGIVTGDNIEIFAADG